MSDIWYLNGNPVNDFPGIARVDSVGHMVAAALEFGRAVNWWDPTNAEDLAEQIRYELENAR